MWLTQLHIIIDLYSPTCGSKEKQKTYTHINTEKYNKQEKSKIRQTKKAMSKCSWHYVSLITYNITTIIVQI